MKTSRTTAVLIGLALLLFALVTLGMYTLKSRPYPGANDFYSRWSGVQSYWMKGLDPYSEEASLAIQIGIYGRPVIAGEDPGYYAYPMYTTFLLAPLAPLPYTWAEAIWLTLLMGMLLGALFLLLNAYKWRPTPWLLGVTALWTLLFYPASRGILLGQPGIAVYFLEVLALWALVKNRDSLAAFALALSTIKPQMGFLIVPFVLLWGLWYRRWRLIGWFVAIWGGLMLLSFVMLPTWFGSWWEQLTLYTSYTVIGSPVWVLTHIYLPQLGTVGEIALSVALLIIMLWAWARTIIQRKSNEFGWTFCLTLTITHLIALRTATPHFVVFIIPLIFYFKYLTDREPRRGPRLVFLIQIALVVSYWVLFLTTVTERFEHPIIYLPLPVGMLLLLLFTRSLWVDKPR
ncbi:glycosyltransferase family 87 protein [Chloroflexota bacterium]